MKRALSFLIALALCLTFLPTSTFAATVLDSGTCGGNLTWTQYDDGTTVISGSGEMTDYQTATMTPWISSWISNLVISSGVTRIGNDAFEDTPPLKSVWIGDTVTQIGMEAFASCPQLTKVVLYASVTDIEYGAFYKCDNLTDVYYYGTPEQWAAINIGYANSPLYNATVHYVDVSAPVTLESIAVETLPDKTTYGKNESLDTTGLTLRANYSNGTSQEITSGFTVAGFDSETVGVKTLTVAYEGLTASFEVTVWQPATSGTCGSDLTWNLDEQGILTISGTGGMYSYSSVVQPWLSHLETITTVIIESGVTDIGGNAFEDCTNLKSVTISDTVTYIGKWAFAGCTGLEEINYNAAAISSLGQSNYVFSRAGAESNGITVNIGANVTKIPAYLFQPGSYSYEHKITAVNFAEGSVCTSIGDSAFYNCTGLTSITIPDSVTSIGSYAFYYCTGLTSITIPEGVTSIGNYAFYNCTGLTSITIPDSVTRIGSYAFSYCTGLTSITIPEGVTSIGSYAFEDCTNLKSVTISDTVTYIGEWAFAGCTGLEEINYNAAAISSLGQSNYAFAYAGQNGNGITVNIGANVTKIPAYLFDPHSYSSYAPKIVAVNLAEGSVCTSIGKAAFYGCTGLTSIIIPDSVTSIGDSAFSSCTGLTSVTIPEGVTSIGNYAFYNCTGLTSITIPDSVTSIGDSAFSYCTGLTSITIGDSVTSIGNWAFSSCTGLTSVTIPEGVTSIGNYAFHNCTSLTDVYYCGTHEQWSAITIGSNNNPLTAATLHVTEVVVTLTGIAIKTQSAKTEYWVGESLDTTCLTLMATYSDGSTKEITEGFTVTGFDSATAGEKTVTVTYEDFTATFTVMVKEPTITGITVKAQPAKTEYWVGESLDTTGLTLTATYSDGSTQEITEGFTVSGFDSATAGEKTVTVTYEGFTATFTVAVNETVIDENAPKIVLESKKVVKGSEFTVTVKIENNPGFTYLEVTPTYDGVLTLVKVENGELISDFTKGKQYVWVADEDVTDDGLLMTFTFSVADTVEPGIYQAGFQLRTCGNYNEEAVTLNIVAADIEVIDYVYGDATGDGVVDGFDVIRLKKYLANYDYETGTSTVEIAAGADANGDGTIDGFDVIRLKKYLANYDYETGSSTVVLGPQ